MTHNDITVGDRVKITTVPAPVLNIALGAMGVIVTSPKVVAGISQAEVKLDDGRVIKWNLDYLERIDRIEDSKSDCSDLTPEIVNLPLDKVRRDGGTQPRAFMNQDTVKEYAQDLELGAVFPPVIVFYDGTSYWLADGFHRVAATESLGRTEIKAEVKQGSSRDAVLLSCGVNATHGLRRTNADKRRAVMRLLNDEEWGVRFVDVEN